jgi:hypothetical protein
MPGHGNHALNAFQTGGSSPPGGEPAPDEAASLPEHLVEELAAILADALEADVEQYPNLAEVLTSQAAMVESPPGHDHKAAPRARTVTSRKKSARTGSDPPSP